jgi:aerobic-type carbon monoxide dehydrogenase small subunit (CoxS/CutS family)
MVTLNVNGVRREVQAPDDTPLLYVLRNDLQLIGPQFGCGLAQCGACAVLIDGKEVRSCVTPVASVANQEITTLEGLPARWAKQKGLSAEEAKRLFTRCSKPGSRNRLRSAGFARTG